MDKPQQFPCDALQKSYHLWKGRLIAMHPLRGMPIKSLMLPGYIVGNRNSNPPFISNNHAFAELTNPQRTSNK